MVENLSRVDCPISAMSPEGGWQLQLSHAEDLTNSGIARPIKPCRHLSQYVGIL